MKILSICGVLMLASLELGAQALPQSALRPALISDSTIQSGDSPLVRAAKLNVARRATSGGGQAIDLKAIGQGGGHFSEASPGSGRFVSPAGAGTSPQANQGPRKLTAAEEAAVAATKRKADALHQEERRMHEQSLEPYAGEVEEGMVDQRVNQIPGEIPHGTVTVQTAQPTPSRPKP
jgi:hypothetical protein